MAPESTTLTTKVESGSPYQLDHDQVFFLFSLGPIAHTYTSNPGLESIRCSSQTYL